MAGGETAERRGYARVDHDALRANFALAQARAGAARVIAVVKADAYGHGVLPVARSLLAAGCAQLAVHSLEEACALRTAGIGAPVLVLGGIEGAEEAREACDRGLEVVIHHAGQVEALAARDDRVGVHVEVDTGMHRSGCAPGAARALLRQVAAAPQLELAGLMTHFASADEPDLSTSLEQLARFRDVLAEARADGAKPRFVHVGNSAALLCGEALAAACPGVNAVRPGLMLYGARPAPHLAGELRPVMSLVARVAQLRAVAAGAAVGYSGSWRAPRATRVATLALGYADGIPVAASNRGHVVIAGRRLPLVGRVSMDSVGVDVGDARVSIGDEALVFGESGDAALPVEEAAAAAGTLAYELLTRVGPRVARIHQRAAG